MIEAASYNKAMSAITQKLGVELSPLMATFYHRVLCHDFETPDFLRGARIVYPQLSRWPAPYDLSAMIASAAGVEPPSFAKPPQTVTDWPSLGDVRAVFGNLIADAYGSANPRHLWSDDDNLQQPAIEAFESALKAAVVRAAMRKDIPRWAPYQSPPKPSVLLAKDLVIPPEMEPIAEIIRNA